MIITLFTDFRFRFRIPAISATANVTFTPSAPGLPATLTRAAGSWITDGFRVGMTLHVAGSTSNDGHYLLIAVTATTLSVRLSQTFIGEGPAIRTVTAEFIDPSGYEGFPEENIGLNNFGPIAGFYVPWTPVSVIGFTVNNLLPDAVSGVDEYDWYLSQRSDTPAEQYFAFTAHLGSNSGTADLKIKPEMLSITNSTLLTPANVLTLYRNCHVYCRRRSDASIAHLDIYRAAFA